MAFLAERNRTPWEVSSCSRCVSCGGNPFRWEPEARQTSGHPAERNLLAASPLAERHPSGELRKGPEGSGDEPSRKRRPQSGATRLPAREMQFDAGSLDRPPLSGGKTSAPGRGRVRSASDEATNDPVLLVGSLASSLAKNPTGFETHPRVSLEPGAQQPPNRPVFCPAHTPAEAGTHGNPMTRRCGDTLQWRRRTGEVERALACNRAFNPDVGRPQGRALLTISRQRRRGRAQPIRPYDD